MTRAYDPARDGADLWRVIATAWAAGDSTRAAVAQWEHDYGIEPVDPVIPFAIVERLNETERILRAEGYTQCAECGHLHFDARLRAYGDCPIRDCGCPMADQGA